MIVQGEELFQYHRVLARKVKPLIYRPIRLMKLPVTTSTPTKPFFTGYKPISGQINRIPLTQKKTRFQLSDQDSLMTVIPLFMLFQGNTSPLA